MGGEAFEDTQPIDLESYERLCITFFPILTVNGVSKIEPVGSSGKKSLMGDIDLAVECSVSRDKLADNLSQFVNVKKFGSGSISVRVPFPQGDGRHVQVDILVGDVKWLKWARNGAEKSEVKGVMRNLLINAVLREGCVGDDIDRIRTAIDWDSGMYEVTQTKRGKNGLLKNWKTTSNRLISSDPDFVVKHLFRFGYSCEDILRFEDVVEAVKMTVPRSKQLLNNFVIEIEELAKKSPRLFGSKPQQTLNAIRRIALG
jgi:hypothetical protein